VAAAVKAAKSTQEARREAKEKVGGVEYSVVRIKEGAIYKDLVDIQVSVAIAPSPIAAHKPLDSST
jgi:hypothetical protein